MNGPSSAEAPEKGSRGSRLLLEIILSIVTVAAICFLPALHLFASNPNDLSLGELMGSVWLFAAIGLGLWIVLRLITRKRPYFAGCLTAIIVFFMVNFSLVTSLFRLFLHNYIAINLLSLVFVALVIVGCAFLFLRLCKTESVGRGILAVICVVFVGLLLFNGVTYFRNVKASGSSAKPTAAPTAVVEAPTPTPEPEEGSIVSQQTPEPAVGTPEATLEATPEETATPVVTEAPKTAEPNIYLLVFDEYGSMGAMQKYYHYDSEAFKSFMRAANINWSESSYSTTNETKYSMTDLNMMDYVSLHKSLSALKKMRKNSAIKNVFQNKLGYALYQHSTSTTWFLNAKNLRYNKYMDLFQKTTMDGVESDEILKQQSIFGIFDSLIGALSPQKPANSSDSESLQKNGYYSSEEIRKSQSYKDNAYRDVANLVLGSLDFWEDPKNFTSTEKRMILSYIKSPHAPFMFDEYGRVLSYSKHLIWEDPRYYTGQYVFITKHIETIFKTIISVDPESIIIVMSDHGVRSHKQDFGEITEKDNCWLFLAVYDQGNTLDVEGMSPVNLMRLIATRLGVNMPPVQDLVTKDSADDLSDVKR